MLIVLEISSKKQPVQSASLVSTTFKTTSAPIGKSSIRLISHYMTLNNFMNRIWLRFIKILDDIAFHLLREDGFGGLWNVDGSLDFATITQSH